MNRPALSFCLGGEVPAMVSLGDHIFVCTEWPIQCAKVEDDTQYGNTSAGFAQEALDQLHSPILRDEEDLCSVEMGMER